jgi:hypothetical protein
MEGRGRKEEAGRGGCEGAEGAIGGDSEEGGKGEEECRYTHHERTITGMKCTGTATK